MTTSTKPAERRHRTPLGWRGAGRLLKRRSLEPLPTTTPYDQGGRILAELSATSLWGGLWLFNGGCTAVAIAMFAQWLATKITHGAPPFWVSFWLMIPVGIVGHIIISSIEQHLWRSGVKPAGTYRERIEALFREVRTGEAIGVGSVDAGTTSFTVRLLLWFFGAPDTLGTTIAAGLLGTGIALVAEPMVKYHGGRLRAMIRHRRRR